MIFVGQTLFSFHFIPDPHSQSDQIGSGSTSLHLSTRREVQKINMYTSFWHIWYLYICIVLCFIPLEILYLTLMNYACYSNVDEILNDCLFESFYLFKMNVVFMYKRMYITSLWKYIDTEFNLNFKLNMRWKNIE